MIEVILRVEETENELKDIETLGRALVKFVNLDLPEEVPYYIRKRREIVVSIQTYRAIRG